MTYRAVSLHTSTVYDALGGIIDEEVRVHLAHRLPHVAVVFGRSATSPIPNRIHVRDLRTFDDVDDKRAAAAISAALVAIRNHHADVAVPNTHIPCPRCEGQGDLGDATDWINAKTLRKSADGQPPELLSFDWACLVADNIPKKKFGDAITMDMESVICKQCRRIITARKQNGLPV